ncbi:MAG: copper chaperone PCu(A)C [Xanthobacteraceae bacterium]
MTRRFFLYLATLILFPIAAVAHEYRAGSLLIGHPWARATPKGAQVAAGYMKIVNQGTAPDRLIGASLATADRVVVHEMKMDGGVMQMRALEHGLEIKPGVTVELTPGSRHMMFEGLRKPLVEGARVKGTLVFEKAGTVAVEYAVEGMGAKSSMPAGVSHTH